MIYSQYFPKGCNSRFISYPLHNNMHYSSFYFHNIWMYGPASSLSCYQKGNNLCLRACNPWRMWMNETLIKMKFSQELKIWNRQSIEYLMNLFISPYWRSSAYNSFNHLSRQGVDRNDTILYYEMVTVECVFWSITELMEQVFRYPASVLWNETY